MGFYVGCLKGGVSVGGGIDIVVVKEEEDR